MLGLASAFQDNRWVMPPATNRTAKHFAAYMEGNTGSEHEGLRKKSHQLCLLHKAVPPHHQEYTSLQPRETVTSRKNSGYFCLPDSKATVALLNKLWGKLLSACVTYKDSAANAMVLQAPSLQQLFTAGILFRDIQKSTEIHVITAQLPGNLWSLCQIIPPGI